MIRKSGHRFSEKIMLKQKGKRASDARSRYGAPCRAPADLDHGKSDEAKQRQPAEKQKAGAESPGRGLGGAKRLGEEISADAAGAADQARHQADILTEAQ